MSESKESKIVNARPDRLIKEVKIKVPMALSALNDVGSMPLTDDSQSIGEPVVIAITSGAVHQTVVVHRPVGFTSLGRSEWVGTPIAECQALLSAAVNPAEERINAKVQVARTNRAVILGLYLKGADGIVRYPPKIHSGDAIASVAKKVSEDFEAAKKQAHDDYIAECEHRRTKPKKDWKFGKNRAAFIPEAVGLYDKAVSKALAADVVMAEEIKKIDPHPYQTLNGPRGNVPQVSIQLTRETTREQMVDVIKNDLMASFSGNRLIGGFQGIVTKQEWDSAKGTLDGCVSFVEKHFPGLKPPALPVVKTTAELESEALKAAELLLAAKKLAD